MSDSGDQTACRNAVVPISYGGTFTGSFQVGSTTTFTITVGTATGGTAVCRPR